MEPIDTGQEHKSGRVFRDRDDEKVKGVEEEAELVFPALESTSDTMMYSNEKDTSHYKSRSRTFDALGNMQTTEIGVPAENTTEVYENKDFLFPRTQAERRKASLPGSMYRRQSVGNLMDVMGHRNRSYSISVTDPVCRSTYESLPHSPATSFLAQFAMRDDYKELPQFDDGCTIQDKYHIGKIIGRGSFSECREGTPVSQGACPYKRLALKIVDCADATTNISENLTKFDKEVETWNRFNHENILPLIDTIKFDKSRVAVSPLAENGSLLSYLERRGPFKELEAKKIFSQIVDAVQHMHSQHGIAHRDIKLDNILLDRNLKPFVCDFGLSERVEEDKTTGSRVKEVLTCNGGCRTETEIYCKGSLWYLPPEEMIPSCQCITSIVENSKKGDIWALGIVLYAMITGKLPFVDDFLPRLHETICNGKYEDIPDHFSEGLKAIIKKMLTVDPSKRPNIDELVNDPWLNN